MRQKRKEERSEIRAKKKREIAMKRSEKKSKRRRKYQQNPSAMYSKSRMKSIIPLSRVRGHVCGEKKQKGLELLECVLSSRRNKEKEKVRTGGPIKRTCVVHNVNDLNRQRKNQRIIVWDLSSLTAFNVERYAWPSLRKDSG